MATYRWDRINPFAGPGDGDTIIMPDGSHWAMQHEIPLPRSRRGGWSLVRDGQRHPTVQFCDGVLELIAALERVGGAYAKPVPDPRGYYDWPACAAYLRVRHGLDPNHVPNENQKSRAWDIAVQADLDKRPAPRCFWDWLISAYPAITQGKRIIFRRSTLAESEPAVRAYGETLLAEFADGGDTLKLHVWW